MLTKFKRKFSHSSSWSFFRDRIWYFSLLSCHFGLLLLRHWYEVHLLGICLFFSLRGDDQLVINHVTPFEVHPLFYVFHFGVDFVKLVHEFVCLAFLVLLLMLLDGHAILEPFLLLLKIFDLDLLFEQ